MRDHVSGLSFTNLCPWILAYFSYNKTVAKWKELPHVTISALRLLPRKGALEAAPEPEITNFSERDSSRISAKKIPEMHPSQESEPRNYS